MLFNNWLAETYDLQHETYGYDLAGMADAVLSPNLVRHRTPLILVAKYLDWNTTAVVQEMAELREEFSWKPWAVDEPFVNRERIIAEAVDALHFIGNILVGVDCTDDELNEAYLAKMKINRERQASGTYSAQKGGLAAGSD